MNQTSLKPILLTGAHRSGTTWAGRMFSLAPEAVYIHEPLNLHHDKGLFTADIDLWFTYICKENEAEFLPAFQNTMKLRYNLVRKIMSLKRMKGIKGALQDFLAFGKYRRQRRVPLMKDPIAIFSSEWLASTYDMNVVVLIRHPAAMAGSVKAKDWHHPFDHFLKQPLLMRDHLSSFQAEIEEFAWQKQDIVDQSALLWKMIYATVLKFQRLHPEWIFIRHEDLARDPLNQFQGLCEKLGLTFTEQVRDQIIAFSKEKSDAGQIKQPLSSLRRDSVSTTTNWKSRLTAEDVARLKNRVQAVSVNFYDDSEW